MNYLWEVMLKLREQGLPEHSIRYQMPDEFSAYMELSMPYLNQESIEENAVVEINPYYRFYHIFKDFSDRIWRNFQSFGKISFISSFTCWHKTMLCLE